MLLVLGGVDAYGVSIGWAQIQKIATNADDVDVAIESAPVRVAVRGGTFPQRPIDRVIIPKSSGNNYTIRLLSPNYSTGVGRKGATPLSNFGIQELYSDPAQGRGGDFTALNIVFLTSALIFISGRC